MQRASQRVKALFNPYQLNIGVSDPAAIAAQYGIVRFCRAAEHSGSEKRRLRQGPVDQLR